MQDSQQLRRLQCCVLFWAPCLEGNQDKLELVLRIVVGGDKRQKQLISKDGKRPGSYPKRRLRRDNIFSTLQGCCIEKATDLPMEDRRKIKYNLLTIKWASRMDTFQESLLALEMIVPGWISPDQGRMLYREFTHHADWDRYLTSILSP